MPQDNSNGNKKTLNEIHREYQYEEKPRRRWPIALAYLWAAFLVAVVIVFGGRWVYRTVKDSDKNKSAGTSQESGQQSAGTEKQAENGAVIVPATPGGQNSSSSSNGSSPAAPAPTEVPNTGDGAPDPDSLPNTGG